MANEYDRPFMTRNEVSPVRHFFNGDPHQISSFQG
jgi:hypothetical protein